MHSVDPVKLPCSWRIQNQRTQKRFSTVHSHAATITSLTPDILGCGFAPTRASTLCTMFSGSGLPKRAAVPGWALYYAPSHMPSRYMSEPFLYALCNSRLCSQDETLSESHIRLFVACHVLFRSLCIPRLAFSGAIETKYTGIYS